MHRVIWIFILVILGSGFVVFSAVTGRADINIFLQRRIIVKDFVNKGDSRFDYMASTLEAVLTRSLQSLPFLELSEEERDRLKQIALTDRYAEQYIQVNGNIVYRLKPIVQNVPAPDDPTAIQIKGSYEVKDETLTVTLLSVNPLSEKSSGPYRIKSFVSQFLSAPSTFFIPFLRSLVKYTFYTIGFSIDPPDATIYCDGRFVGIGEVHSFFVVPGYHSIEVYRDGYQRYSQLLYIDRDGITKKIVLAKEKVIQGPLVTTTPEKCALYIDDRFFGYSPIKLKLPKGSHTVTIRKEGYVSHTIATDVLLRDYPEIYRVSLITNEEYERLKIYSLKHKKRARFYLYGGWIATAASIVGGMERTRALQAADLYRGVNDTRYQDSLHNVSLYTALTVISGVSAVTLFSISFAELVAYFKGYEYYAQPKTKSPVH